MDIEIIDCQIRPNSTRLGHVVLRYFELIMFCDIVYNAKHKTAWIRMPEKWLTTNEKVRHCWWPNKEKSDEFQNLVLSKIFDKYSLNLSTLAGIHKSAMVKRTKKLTALKTKRPSLV